MSNIWIWERITSTRQRVWNKNSQKNAATFQQPGHRIQLSGFSTCHWSWQAGAVLDLPVQQSLRSSRVAYGASKDGHRKLPVTLKAIAIKQNLKNNKAAFIDWWLIGPLIVRLIALPCTVARLALLEPKTRNLALLRSTWLQKFYFATFLLFCNFFVVQIFLEEELRVARVPCSLSPPP